MEVVVGSQRGYRAVPSHSSRTGRRMGTLPQVVHVPNDFVHPDRVWQDSEQGHRDDGYKPYRLEIVESAKPRHGAPPVMVEAPPRRSKNLAAVPRRCH